MKKMTDLQNLGNIAFPDVKNEPVSAADIGTGYVSGSEGCIKKSECKDEKGNIVMTIIRYYENASFPTFITRQIIN